MRKVRLNGFGATTQEHAGHHQRGDGGNLGGGEDVLDDLAVFQSTRVGPGE